MKISRQNEEIITYHKKERKTARKEWRNWCSQTRLIVKLPNVNYQLEADKGGIKALSKIGPHSKGVYYTC